jgi:hypothetical protein
MKSLDLPFQPRECTPEIDGPIQCQTPHLTFLQKKGNVGSSVYDRLTSITFFATAATVIVPG